MRRLLLIRHGATPVTGTGAFQGWIDHALSERGRADLCETSRRLAGESPHVVWSSDLRRAVETAQLLFPCAPRRLDTRLREIAFGSFEGRTAADLEADESAAYQGWLTNAAVHPPPGGESLGEFRRRVIDWWEALDAESVTVVTHGGPCGVLLAHLLPLADLNRDAVPRPAGYVELRSAEDVSEDRPAGWCVVTSHLVASLSR